MHAARMELNDSDAPTRETPSAQRTTMSSAVHYQPVRTAREVSIDVDAAGDHDHAPLIASSESVRLTQRISPTTTPGKRSTARSSAAPIHYPLARMHSPINYNVAQYVLFLFLAFGFAYVMWDVYNPNAQHLAKVTPIVPPTPVTPVTPPPVQVTPVESTPVQTAPVETAPSEVVTPPKFEPDAEIPLVFSTIPSPRREPWWMERVAAIDRDLAAQGATAKLAFIGDSITQQWLEAGSVVWREKYASVAVNLGLSGDQTQHVLGGQLSKLGPEVEVVVLMVGTNNSGFNRPPVETLLGVRAVVRAIRNRMPEHVQVVVLHIFPRGQAGPFRSNQLVNAGLKAAVEDSARGIHVYDLSSLFTASHAAVSSEQLDPPPMDMERTTHDQLHLSAAGYRAWANALEPILAKHRARAAELRGKKGA
jgi:lysophospholipase L1-like esterase